MLVRLNDINIPGGRKVNYEEKYNEVEKRLLAEKEYFIRALYTIS